MKGKEILLQLRNVLHALQFSRSHTHRYKTSLTFIVSTGKIKFWGQLTQFVNMELSRCNAISQCRLRVDQISVDHVNPERQQ